MVINCTETNKENVVIFKWNIRYYKQHNGTKYSTRLVLADVLLRINSKNKTICYWYYYHNYYYS